MRSAQRAPGVWNAPIRCHSDGVGAHVGRGAKLLMAKLSLLLALLLLLRVTSELSDFKSAPSSHRG